MAQAVKGRVGSKGELFPPKKLRESIGIRPRSEVRYRAEGGRLVVEPLPSLRDVLAEPPAVVVSAADVRTNRTKLSRAAER